MNDHIYLAHHGIKGQKWGVRRFQKEDGSLTSAGKERYSSEQYRRDVSVYGRSGAKRIQKRVEKKGMSVSGARSDEARRINSARRRALVGGQIGAGVGMAVGGVGGLMASRYVNRFLSKHGNDIFNEPSIQSSIAMATAATSAKVAETLGREGGRAIGMLSGGYSPDRYQNG